MVVVRRFERLLLDGGHDHRFVAAVLPLADSPVAAAETLAEKPVDAAMREAQDEAFAREADEGP